MLVLAVRCRSLASFDASLQLSSLQSNFVPRPGKHSVLSRVSDLPIRSKIRPRSQRVCLVHAENVYAPRPDDISPDFLGHRDAYSPRWNSFLGQVPLAGFVITFRF